MFQRSIHAWRLRSSAPQRIPRGVRIVALILAAALLLPTPEPRISAQESTAPPAITIYVDEAPLHGGPGLETELIGLLPNGATVRMTGEQVWWEEDIWTEVEDGDGRRGWMPSWSLFALSLEAPNAMPATGTSPTEPIDLSADLSAGAAAFALLELPTPRPPTATVTPRRSSSSSSRDGDEDDNDNRSSSARSSTRSRTPTPTVSVAQDARPATVKRGNQDTHTMVMEEERAPDGRPIRSGGIIVKYRSGTSTQARSDAHTNARAASVESMRLRNTERVAVPSGTVDQALQSYRARPDVEWAEPDYLIRKLGTPNDTQFSNQWGMTKIKAPTAWDVTHSSSAVKVAILDCGIYSSSSTYVNTAVDPQPGHVDVRNKVVLEQNFTTSPNGADDYCNHGTHVAGIAAASTNNGLGVAGVGFDAPILNGKVLGDDGSGATSWIANGIQWAADNGAKVINMSLGGSGACSAAFQTAIDYAWSKGVVIVAAAGNSNANGAGQPANCNNVIAVAATDQNDARASFSNYGSNVDVAAPGVSILSSDYVGTYSSFNGTSMASPHVAGLAALIWATSHGTSNQAVVNRLLSTSDQISGTGTFWSAGRINAESAVGGSSSSNPTPTFTSTPTVTSTTVTPTTTPTATTTPTITPTPGLCSPRPPVGLQTAPDGPGRLRVTVSAGSSSVRLRSLRFGNGTNALVDVQSQSGITGNVEIALPSAPQQVVFYVRRATANVATTVPMVVIDDCGEWSTLVGGGPTAF